MSTASAPAAAPLPELDHERVATVVGHRSGLPITVALHSSALGPALGGCRLWSYSHWSDGLGDALRLARAMTMKNALADIGAGGGKAVIALPPGHVLDDVQRRDALLDLGDLVESFGGSYITTEDVGVTEHDMAVVRERTAHVVGLPAASGGSGEPGAATAVGVRASIGEVLRVLDGSPDVGGRSFVIAGLGQVGSRLARLLAADGAILTATDINPAARSIADDIGANWIEPDAALTTTADVFVPAGLGGVLTADAIERLPVRAVCGPANNPLAERRGADALAARGILYAPDYVVNAGGVIHLALTERGESPDRVLARVTAIGDTLADVLARAAADGSTPLDAADAIALARVAAAR